MSPADKPFRPNKQFAPSSASSAVNSIRDDADRDQQYGDYVRRHWLKQQDQASAENARITRRAQKPH